MGPALGSLPAARPFFAAGSDWGRYRAWPFGPLGDLGPRPPRAEGWYASAAPPLSNTQVGG
eukprot:2025390-Alexandrium_andersonii.AAC.1